MEKKLYRDEQRKKLGGVCAGLADYFGVDVAIVRILFVVSFIMKGFGGLLYVILWIALPKKNPFIQGPEVDYRVPPQDPVNPFADRQQPNFTMPNYGQAQEPFGNVPPIKKRCNTNHLSALSGGILIVVGVGFLLNEFNLIPDIDFDVIWPVVLVLAGIAFIFSGSKRKPWEAEQWEKEKPEFDTNQSTETSQPANDPASTENNSDKPVNE